MSPRWRVVRMVHSLGVFWVAFQTATSRCELFQTFSEAVEFAQAAARESWGYRA